MQLLCQEQNFDAHPIDPWQGFLSFFIVYHDNSVGLYRVHMMSNNPTNPLSPCSLSSSIQAKQLNADLLLFSLLLFPYHRNVNVASPRNGLKLFLEIG